MKSEKQNVGLVRWSARIIGIAFAAFISIFAMDVFSEGYDFWNTVDALFMHLIPTFIVIAVVMLAWRWEWIGGMAFLILGLVYVFFAWGKIDRAGVVLICVPLFVLAILFFIGWYQRKHQHA